MKYTLAWIDVIYSIGCKPWTTVILLWIVFFICYKAFFNDFLEFLNNNNLTQNELKICLAIFSILNDKNIEYYDF